mgnify:CR=1 FL=1
MERNRTLQALFALSVAGAVIVACSQSESVANDSGISYLKKEGGAPGLVARFDGKDISLEDLEKSSPGIYNARLDVYKAQKAALDDYIRDRVLEGMAKKAGKPVTAELPAIKPTTYNPNPNPQSAVSVNEVAANLDHKKLRILDARSPDRFRGENETLDPVAGHIPGAINRFFRNNLADNGCFKPATELNAEFTSLLNAHTPASVVHQCGSGVTACHNLLAMEVAGLSGSRLFPGSWSEWVSERKRPVVVGA